MRPHGKGLFYSSGEWSSWRSANDADVYNRELNTFDYAWLVEDSPADLLLGKSGYEMGYSFHL